MTSFWFCGICKTTGGEQCACGIRMGDGSNHTRLTFGAENDAISLLRSIDAKLSMLLGRRQSDRFLEETVDSPNRNT